MSILRQENYPVLGRAAIPGLAVVFPCCVRFRFQSQDVAVLYILFGVDLSKSAVAAKGATGADVSTMVLHHKKWNWDNLFIFLSAMNIANFTILRRADATGFLNGIASVSGVSLPSETTLWLNHIFNNLWRISDTDSMDSSQEYGYPVFVSRAFREAEAYGGLEPYISSAIGAGLVKNLELTKAMRPTDVAYISLFSLSLGRRPPVIRNLRLGDEIVQRDPSKIELDFDVDAIFEDMSLVLGKIVWRLCHSPTTLYFICFLS